MFFHLQIENLRSGEWLADSQRICLETDVQTKPDRLTKQAVCLSARSAKQLLQLLRENEAEIEAAARAMQ